jgi:hypothetical protein
VKFLPPAKSLALGSDKAKMVVQESEALHFHALKVIPVKRGGWCSKVGVGSRGRGLWKFISKEWHHFSNHIRIIPSDGSRISFCGGGVVWQFASFGGVPGVV